MTAKTARLTYDTINTVTTPLNAINDFGQFGQTKGLQRLTVAGTWISPIASSGIEVVGHVGMASHGKVTVRLAQGDWGCLIEF